MLHIVLTVKLCIVNDFQLPSHQQFFIGYSQLVVVAILD